MSRKVIIAILIVLGMIFPGASLFASNWSANFRWQAGKSTLDLSSRENTSNIALIDALASYGVVDKIARINVTSYSSPEGSLSWNTKLAARRSAAIVALLKEKMPGLTDSQIVVTDVPEDWASTEAYVRACNKQWKEEALTLLKSGKNDKESLLQDLWGGVVWDDLLWNCFTRIRRTEIRVEYITNMQISATSATPAEKPSDEQVKPTNERFSVKFPAGKSEILSHYLDNTEQLQSLQNWIESLPPGSAVVLDALSSPEGKVSWNMTLARRRAEAVKRQLVKLGVSVDRITVRTCEENWAGLREVVASSWAGSDKDDILRIIDDESINDSSKKDQLIALDGGVTWSRLIVASMQPLRCVMISATAE